MIPMDWAANSGAFNRRNLLWATISVFQITGLVISKSPSDSPSRYSSGKSSEASLVRRANRGGRRPLEPRLKAPHPAGARESQCPLGS